MTHPDPASQAAHDAFERQMQDGIAMLATMKMSPPVTLGHLTFVVCLRCSAMVLLVDEFPGLTNGGPTPVDQHHAWHQALEEGIHL